MMKNILMLFIFLISFLTNSFSAGGENLTSNEELFPFRDFNYGYMDKNGHTIIKNQFLYGWNFSEGLARVMINDGKIGFIDKDGHFIVTPQFDDGWSFSEGLAAVKLNDKYGYIDKKGRFIITPQFDEAWSFSEGLALVKAGDKYGYIDKKGQFIIPPQFDDGSGIKRRSGKIMGRSIENRSSSSEEHL